jgi:hypothetical protein
MYNEYIYPNLKIFIMKNKRNWASSKLNFFLFKIFFLKIKNFYSQVVTYAFTPSAWEAEARGSQVSGQTGIHRDLV